MKKFFEGGIQQPEKRLLKNLSARYAKGDLERLFHTLNIALDIRPHQTETSTYHNYIIINIITPHRSPFKRSKPKGYKGWQALL